MVLKALIRCHFPSLLSPPPRHAKARATGMHFPLAALILTYLSVLPYRTAMQITTRLLFCVTCSSRLTTECKHPCLIPDKIAVTVAALSFTVLPTASPTRRRLLAAGVGREEGEQASENALVVLTPWLHDSIILLHRHLCLQGFPPFGSGLGLSHLFSKPEG